MNKVWYKREDGFFMYRINTMIRQKWTGLCFWAALLVTPSLFASSAVISWQSNTESDLAGYKIYYGTSSGKYSVILNVGKVVKYEINDLTSNMVYYFAVTAYDQSGNESGFSSEVSYLAEDKDPPTVVSAACELIDKVRVVFSEAVEKVSAEMPSNYKIDKGIVVQKAELQSDNKTVTLNTTQHPNGSYTLTVQNVRDRATVPNAMTSGQASYTWNVVDTTPPTVLSVKLLLKDLLAVEFSEPLNQASALDSLNYSILPSMKIKSRGIDDSFRKVFLSTDFHEVGKTYTLTVKNVKDGAGNTIASNTQKTYVCTSDDSIPPILIAVRLKSKTAVELQFNEKLDGATAEIKTNYTITPSVTVQSAVLSSDKTVVALTTAEHQAGSYSVTVKSVGDNAYPSNLLDSSTLEYTYTPSDVTPPGLQAVEMTSNNILKVVFNESVDEASATFKGNYVIDPHVNISSASLDGSRKIVFLVTEPHPAGSYRVTVNGVKDCSGNPIQSGTYKSYVYQAPDEVPPELLRAELHGSDVLELIFSETLDRITSERIANYRIEPAVEIKTAALVGDSLNKVYLQTAHHPQGKTYTVTVQGVVDRAVVPNAIKTGTKTTYEFPLVDTTPPRLVSVELLGDYFLELNFSEPMDRASAETLASYSVTPSLGVTKATLDASLKKVLLKTGKHQPGTDYRVIVQNVKDLAIPPNTIGDENKKDYSCVSLDAVPPRLVRAELLGNTVLELTFSEGLEETSALDKKNYGIDHGVSILEVKLSRTQECVYLTTTSHKQGTYTVTVQSVKDMASIPNLIQSENNYTYTYTPPDTIPPVLLSVDVLNASMVKLTFNEPLHRLSVEDTTHYAINNGVTVKRAFLDADMTRVILQTSEHKPGSYTITLNGIQDGSSSRNAIVRNTVGHYTYVINDQTPPKIVSAVLDNDKKLVVDFSETLDLASAESRSNYVINNNIEVKNAYLISSGNRVVLETSAHAAGEYILTVNGIKDASTSKNPIAPYSQIFYSWSPIDTVGPELVSATLHTNSNLKLTFNEPVDGVESKKIGNYQINPYVQILHAVLDADLNVVWLTTAPHNPGSYSVTVSNVKDRAFKSNSMGLQNKVDYRYIPPDVDPPSLVSVTIKSPMLLQLVFSEELSRTSAENVVNYSISPNMKIYQASLLATLTTVLLETDPHQAMTNYTISIQGIKDRAPIPNVLTNPITKNYIYTPPDSDPPELLSVKLQGT
ncbi:MAG: fibronectin type III domain-containing protein, partial [bacterium]